MKLFLLLTLFTMGQSMVYGKTEEISSADKFCDLVNTGDKNKMEQYLESITNPQDLKMLGLASLPVMKDRLAAQKKIIQEGLKNNPDSLPMYALILGNLFADKKLPQFDSKGRKISAIESINYVLENPNSIYYSYANTHGVNHIGYILNTM